MLDDIREGLVDCVVVKDLSRFGRNYIESGRYIEKIFPMLGVRFIAVNDGYAADVVRDIFAMKLTGCSLKAIADKLNRDGILSPLQYKKSIGIWLESSFRKDMEPKWSYNAVLRILKNEVYVGTVVQGKCTTPNYKVKKRVTTTTESNSFM